VPGGRTHQPAERPEHQQQNDNPAPTFRTEALHAAVRIHVYPGDSARRPGPSGHCGCSTRRHRYRARLGAVVPCPGRVLPLHRSRHDNRYLLRRPRHLDLELLACDGSQRNTMRVPRHRPPVGQRISAWGAPGQPRTDAARQYSSRTFADSWRHLHLQHEPVGSLHRDHGPGAHPCRARHQHHFCHRCLPRLSRCHSWHCGTPLVLSAPRRLAMDGWAHGGRAARSSSSQQPGGVNIIKICMTK
jgi:hypothetical protein